MVLFRSYIPDAYYGLALVIIRAEIDSPGTVKLKAVSDGLEAAAIEIVSK